MNNNMILVREMSEAVHEICDMLTPIIDGEESISSETYLNIKKIIDAVERERNCVTDLSETPKTSVNTGITAIIETLVARGYINDSDKDRVLHVVKEITA